MTGKWSHLRSNDIPFKHQLAIHQALRLAHDPAMAIPDLLAKKKHPLAGHDLSAEAAFVSSPETDEARPLHVFLGVERRQLRRGFDHQHARKQGPARDMPRDPELVRPDVFVAQNQALI